MARRSGLLAAVAGVLVGCADAGSGSPATTTGAADSAAAVADTAARPGDAVQANDSQTSRQPADSGGADAASPGQDTTARATDVALPSDPTLIINEIVASGAPDWFELYNPGTTAVSLAGWKFADSATIFTNAVPFAKSGSVPPGGFFMLKVSKAVNGFGLGAGESLTVLRADGKPCDTINWGKGDSPTGGSYARVPDGVGKFVVSKHPTPGAANQP